MVLQVEGIGKRLTEDDEIDGGGSLARREEDGKTRRTAVAKEKLFEG